MTLAPTPILPLTRPSQGYGDFPPPPWIADLFSLRHADQEKSLSPTLSLRTTHTPTHALISARIPNALALSAPALEHAVSTAYLSIRTALSRTPAPHPIRFWNYVPSITDRLPDSDGRDRYMVFNAGRFHAFSSWYHDPHNFDRQVPTASGVGHPGQDLVIHCLSASSPGTPISNPRQVQPYHYSQRFGPLPPCFARATLLPPTAKPRASALGSSPESPPVLLVGGTASIRGEDSLHVLDFAGQMGETLANLAALVHTASAFSRVPGGRAPSPPKRSNDLSPLKHYRELRVYLPDANRSRIVTQMISDAFPNLHRLELLHSDLCRPELLVEIEGLAQLPQ